MVKYRGYQVEVRMATTEGGLGTAPAVTEIASIEYDKEENISLEAKGIGMGRGTEVSEGLIELTGSLTRRWNKIAVVPSPSTTTFAEMVGEYETGAKTRLYVQVKQIDTGDVDLLKKVIGKYHKTQSEEGFIEESYDFKFEELTHS